MYGKYGEIIEIKYTTKSGKGCMTLNVENFLPCGKRDLNFILKKIIPLTSDYDRNEIIQKMKSCCVQIINDSYKQKDCFHRFKALKKVIEKCEQNISILNQYIDKE